MASRTALITGALGQDGSLLAELLASRGVRVVGLVRHLPPGGNGAVATACDELVSIDLTDRVVVRKLIDTHAPHAIYHLAASHHSAQDASTSASLAGKEAMLATNFLSTRALAFALVEAKADCSLVYAASSQMFTATSQTEVVEIATPRRPATFYGHTKSWSMDLLAFLRRESGLRASTAVLFNHESTRRGVQFVSRKITQAAARAAAGLQQTLEVHNVGTRVDWSSAHDVVRALALMAECDAAGDHIVASGSLHSVRDLLSVAFGHVGLDWETHTQVREDVATPALLGRPDTLETLGWCRSVNFEAMIGEMVDHDHDLISRRLSPPRS